MTHEIVISRFKEDIAWVEVPKRLGYEITVYNKHEGANLLANVGKESHTYLTHIVKNYDNLSDVTVFLQGEPFSHCKDLYELLSVIKNFNVKFDYARLSDGTIICDGNGRPHCGPEHLPLSRLYQYIFETQAPEVFVCNPAGQFAVTRGAIHKNPRMIYEKCLNALSYSMNPIEGFCMERMWFSLFGFKHAVKLEDIDYRNDDYIDVDEYIALSRDDKGNFIHLGEFGFDKSIR